MVKNILSNTETMFIGDSAKRLTLMCLFMLFAIINMGCEESNTTASVVEESDITILNPRAGKDYFYSRFEYMDIMYSFNPKTIKTPAQFYYSEDDKKTWNPIKPDVHRYNTTSRTENSSLEHATFRWTPEKDSLKEVFIYLKATGYNPDPFDDIDIIGPVEID